MNSEEIIEIVNETLNETEIDPYAMAAASIDTAVRNLIALGVPLDKIAILDNFCWCSSDSPERLWQLKEAAKACYDTAISYGTPFISGKDSMFNDFKGFTNDGKEIKISVPPTLLISSIGIMQDVKKAVTLDAKIPGDLIYLIGSTRDEMGGSEYLLMVTKGQANTGTNVPKVDTKVNKIIYESFSKAIEKEILVSSQSIGRGGLAVALFKTLMGGKLGSDIRLLSRLKSDVLLFSESQGRILATINPDNKKVFENIFKNVPYDLIGKVSDNEEIKISHGKKVIVNTSVNISLQSYRKTFSNY